MTCVSSPNRVSVSYTVLGHSVCCDVSGNSWEFKETARVIACLCLGTSPVSLSTFRSIWRAYANDIQIMKPRTDVCSSCDKLRERVRLAKTEEATREALQQLTDHINEANDERELYKSMVETVKQELEDLYIF